MPSTDNDPEVPVVVAPEAPTSPVQPVSNPNPTPTPPTPNPDVLLPWVFGQSLTHNNWHNVRVLCDLEGLSFEDKEDLCATVWGESEFNTAAKCYNYARKVDGTKYLSSTDVGIAQWNDKYHPEISSHDAEFDPEKAIRLMCKAWKTGHKNWWVAYTGGRYLQFKGKTL